MCTQEQSKFQGKFQEKNSKGRKTALQRINSLTQIFVRVMMMK